MKQRQVEELIECLTNDREVFFYHKDRYANLLLKVVLKYENDISNIKQSVFGKLLNVRNIKEDLAHCGIGSVQADDITFDWKAECFPFTVTYSQWGSERYRSQTSRSGLSLVIQLNFSNLHNYEYRKLYKPTANGVFNYCGHPVLFENDGHAKRETLAWARVDLDFSSNEALIEEIQTDWLRLARREMMRIGRMEKKLGQEVRARDSDAVAKRAKQYLTEILKPYEKIWAEAMLACTLNVLLNEIGINQIFYHTHICGRIIKDIPGRSPPRSLYTALPRRFCFQQSKYGPSFIEETRRFKKIRRRYPFLKWQKLDIKGEFHVKQTQKIAQAA